LSGKCLQALAKSFAAPSHFSVVSVPNNSISSGMPGEEAGGTSVVAEPVGCSRRGVEGGVEAVMRKLVSSGRVDSCM